MQIAYHLGDQTAMCAEVMGCLMGVVVAFNLIENASKSTIEGACADTFQAWLSDRVGRGTGDP